MSTTQQEPCSGPVLPPGRVRRWFPKGFTADAVALVLDEGRSIASVARSLRIGESNLGNWVRQPRVDRGGREGLAIGERPELALLRRENSPLRTERDLLKRATGFLGERIWAVTRYRGVLAQGSEGFPTKLRSRGHRLNPKRVARLMKAQRIAVIHPQRPKRTTTPHAVESLPP